MRGRGFDKVAIESLTPTVLMPNHAHFFSRGLAPVFTLVYLCLPLFTTIYNVPVLTLVYQCLATCVYLCLPKF